MNNRPQYVSLAVAFSLIMLSAIVFFRSGNLQLVYAQSTGQGSITVVGTNLNGGAPVNGIHVDLRVNGTDVQNGTIPVTFHNLSYGVQYGVVVYWYQNYYIRYINSSYFSTPDLQRYALVTLNQSYPSVTLDSVFEYVPPSEAAKLNVVAEFPNGTKLGTASVVNGYDLHTPGMWLQVTPPGQSAPYTGTFTGGSILPFVLFNHETYTVQMSLGYQGPWITTLSNQGPNVNVTWSHWEDNNSPNATRAVTLNGDATYVAIYEQVAYNAPLTTASSSASGSSSSNTPLSRSNSQDNTSDPINFEGTSSLTTSSNNPISSYYLGSNPFVAEAAIAILIIFSVAFGYRYFHKKTIL